jgi:hypothetical protein
MKMKMFMNGNEESEREDGKVGQRDMNTQISKYHANAISSLFM